MKAYRTVARWLLALVLSSFSTLGVTADWPQQKEGDWVVRDFRFRSGGVLPELRLHYTTLGAPTGEPVVILYGTGQSGTTMLAAPFAGECSVPARLSISRATT